MTDQRPLALVTGASSGIGLELARQFAGAGFDLVVNAEDDELTAAADSLRSGGAGVTPVRADLRAIAGVEAVWSAVQGTGRPLAAAALNAGVGRGGAFVDDDIETQLEVIDLNVVSTVRLAHLVLRDMAARGEGRVLITSSVAATMPGAFQAVYNASKAFLQSFSEALTEELTGTGVTVTALMPGPTDTEFFDRAQLQDTRIGTGPKDDPAQVAEQGFAGLMKGEQKVFAGSFMSRAQAVASGLIPDRLKSKAHRQMAEPGSAG